MSDHDPDDAPDAQEPDAPTPPADEHGATRDEAPTSADPDAPDAPDAEPPVEDESGNEPYQRRVAVVLALLAVIGAWIAILATDAGTAESYYARETTRTAVQSLRANVNQSTVAGLSTDLDAEQEALALTRPFRLDESGFSTLGVDTATEAEVEDELDDAQQTVAGLDRAQLERVQTFEAERLDLKRSALAETRVTYNNRASQYETVITTLGVALFLVGFTMVLRKQTRPPILVPGVILAIYVVGWALWIHHREVPDTPDEAIEQAAEGATELQLGEPAAAVERYQQAIEIDDDFVAAYEGRSYASWQTANPDFVRTLAVVDTDSELADRARSDAAEANRLGDDQDFQGLVLSGAYRFYDADYEGAIERLEQAVEVNGQAPEAYALIAASQVALGDLDAASESLDDVTALLDTAEASRQTRQIAADLFTFLERVEAEVPERAEDVEDVRAALVDAEGSLTFGARLTGTRPPGATVEVEQLELAVVEEDEENPGLLPGLEELELSLAASFAGLPAGTDVSMYLYEQPADGSPFVQAAELARFSEIEGDQAVAGTAVLTRACRPVALRLDLYLDGALAESFEAPGLDPTC